MSALAEPYDLIAGELRGLAEREGPELWRNRTRLTGLLLDHQPDLRREVRAIVAAVEQGVARALSESERSLAAITIDRQASLMETEAGLRPEVAQNVTRAIAHALNLGPLPSVYGHGAPPPSVQPVPAPQPAWDPSSSRGGGHAGSSYTPARPFPWPPIILGGAVLAATAILLVPVLRNTADNSEVAVVSPQPTPTPPAEAPAQGYGQELADFGVPGQSNLRPVVGGPTPLQIPVGRRITTSELRDLIAREPQTLLIDVLADGHAVTLANAHYVPAGGQPGSFADAIQTALKDTLDNLTGTDPSRPIVFFCAGASCWESYNAVLRAHLMGYTNLYWYRGGLTAWQQAGLPMQPLPAPTAAAAGGDE